MTLKSNQAPQQSVATFSCACVCFEGNIHKNKTTTEQTTQTLHTLSQHTHSLTRTHTHTLIHSLTTAHADTHTHSLSLSQTHTHSLPPSLTLMHTRAQPKTHDATKERVVMENSAMHARTRALSVILDDPSTIAKSIKNSALSFTSTMRKRAMAR